MRSARDVDAPSDILQDVHHRLFPWLPRPRRSSLWRSSCGNMHRQPNRALLLRSFGNPLACAPMRRPPEIAHSTLFSVDTKEHNPDPTSRTDSNASRANSVSGRWGWAALLGATWPADSVRSLCRRLAITISLTHTPSRLAAHPSTTPSPPPTRSPPVAIRRRSRLSRARQEALDIWPTSASGRYHRREV